MDDCAQSACVRELCASVARAVPFGKEQAALGVTWEALFFNASVCVNRSFWDVKRRLIVQAQYFGRLRVCVAVPL